VDMNDPFGGPGNLHPTQSTFDVNHKPARATMRWELEANGCYLLVTEGVDQKGAPKVEKPQHLRPDGVASPVDGLPGLTSVTTRPNRNTIRAEVRREDG